MVAVKTEYRVFLKEYIFLGLRSLDRALVEPRVELIKINRTADVNKEQLSINNKSPKLGLSTDEMRMNKSLSSTWMETLWRCRVSRG